MRATLAHLSSASFAEMDAWTFDRLRVEYYELVTFVNDYKGKQPF